MKTTLCTLLLLVFTSVSFAQNKVNLPQVKVQGNSFVIAGSNKLIFRGVSTSDPDKLERQGHWDKLYFEEIKKWGANVVRFPVHPTAWRARGKTAYLKMLDQGVEWAGELGIYVIIDWHSIGNLKNEMYQSAMYDTSIKETYDFWRTISIHYKGNNTVAFFELFNEPTIMQGQLGTCSWAEWSRLMEECIVIIRANGAEAIPLVAGFNWAYNLTEVANQPINAEGIAYVSHPYPQKRNKPWEAQWTQDWGFVAKKYPLILTEIGFAVAGERGAHVPVISDESYGEAITKYADDHGISYVVWDFDPNWAPTLFTDWNYTPSRQGIFFKKALQKHSGQK